MTSISVPTATANSPAPPFLSPTGRLGQTLSTSSIASTCSIATALPATASRAPVDGSTWAPRRVAPASLRSLVRAATVVRRTGLAPEASATVPDFVGSTGSRTRPSTADRLGSASLVIPTPTRRTATRQSTRATCPRTTQIRRVATLPTRICRAIRVTRRPTVIPRTTPGRPRASTTTATASTTKRTQQVVRPRRPRPLRPRHRHPRRL